MTSAVSLDRHHRRLISSITTIPLAEVKHNSKTHLNPSVLDAASGNRPDAP
jgi:hypothetical protein